MKKNWEFQECYKLSRSGEAQARQALEAYFHKPEKFMFDPSPQDRAFEHDFNVSVFGQIYKIEHKHRMKDYGDELLELISSTATGRRGWTFRAGEADFVLFTYAPTKRFTIWPGATLQSAFEENHADWSNAYGIKEAKNDGYVTINIPVPTKILKEALSRHGAPPCPHCGNNVGVFHEKCNCCGLLSCCATGDGNWFCEECARWI